MHELLNSDQFVKMQEATFNQREVAFLNTVYGRSGILCHCVNVPLRSEVDVSDLESRIKRVLLDNEQLRGFLKKFGETHSYEIHPSSYIEDKFSLGVLDLSGYDLEVKNKKLEEFKRTEVSRGFDIYCDLALRFTLIQLDDEDFEIFFMVHNLVCDERSLKQLVNMVTDNTEYNAGSPREGTSTLLEEQSPQELVDFWRERLRMCPSITSYPASEIREEKRTFSMNVSSIELGNQRIKKILSLIKGESSSLEVFFTAAYQLFSHIYCQQEYFSTGIDYYFSGSEGVIGNNSNRLPVVSQLSDVSFSQWLKDIDAQLDENRAHGEMPFGEIVDAVGADKGVNYHPIFQSMFSFNRVSPLSSFDVPMYSHFDMKLMVDERPNKKIDVNFALSTELFTPHTQSEITRYFINFLDNIINNPLSNSITGLTLTDDALLKEIQSSWQRNIEPIESFPTLHQCFERQVEENPDQEAVLYNDEVLSYKEFNSRANQCARLIAEKVGKKQAKIALEAEDPLHMMIAIFAVLKSGNVFVAIDPDYPLNRREYIIENAGVDLIISHALERYGDALSAAAMPFDNFLDGSAKYDSDNLMLDVTGTDLACFIYTSGSTGKPKGVMLKHAGIVNMSRVMKKKCKINRDSCFLLFHSFGFDASMNDWSAALCNGAKLALVKRSNTNILEEVSSAFKKYPVTIGLFPASFLSFFEPCDFPRLESLILAGEPCNKDIVEKWTKDFFVLNGYGPTETTIICCSFDCNPKYPANTIGNAVDNVLLVVLDNYLNPVPKNVMGELYIGGVGLAKGYVGSPELTKNAFIEIDLESVGSVRLYKTNDLVKVTSDGHIEYIRRKDRVEKIFGFRVSLTEIDYVLKQHPIVKNAVSVSSENDENTILSYVVLNDTNMNESDSVDQWRNIFENSIDYTSRNSDKTFNVSGWSSSYDGSEISDSAMKNWLDGTIERINSLKPKKLLEVGCGSGLLLFELASNLEKYSGTDISKDALLSIKDAMPEGGIEGVSVDVHRLQANELSKFLDNSVDTIVCNSVVQYFPSVDYLLEVFDGFFRVLEEGGSIFLGDVRNKKLAAHFHALVEEAKTNEVGEKDFKLKVDQRIHRDSELLIDPDFFTLLKHRFPQISQVRALIKRGYDSNEMTQFRYDVIIDTNSEPNFHVAKELLWSKLGSIDKLNESFNSDSPVIVRSVPNARATQAVSLLNEDHIHSFQSHSMEPEDFFVLGDKLGLSTQISYSKNKGDTYFDVAFSKDGIFLMPNEWQVMANFDVEIRRKVNIPFNAKRELACVADINDYLKSELPSFMRPRQVFCIDYIPYNMSGKLDRKKLPTSKSGKRLARSEVQELVTPTERRLGEIWKQLLDLDNVSRDDKFFDLGGTSFMFLGFISDIDEEFSTKLSVMDIMRLSLCEISEKIDSKNTKQVEKTCYELEEV